MIREFFDWRPRAVAVSRARCHYLVLDVHSIPPRRVAASLRLQLAQLNGLARFGFAWRVDAGRAEVWYWDEEYEAEAALRTAASRTSVATLASGTGRNGIVPWPEPLLRASPGGGLRLITCTEGYEAVAVEGGRLLRTRWLPERPDEDVWAAFVRDLGHPPSAYRLPSAEKAVLLARPATGWKLSTHLVRPVPRRVWGGVAAAAIAGALLLAGGVFEFRLDRMLRAQKTEIARLMQDNAATIDLQKRIDEQREYLDAMAKARPGTLQLLLLKQMAESGLIGTATGIAIAEWEYRNGRLRILFSVPEEGFSLGEFLARLESQPMFGEVRLIPDTPPRIVGIQAMLAGRPRGGDSRPAKNG